MPKFNGTLTLSFGGKTAASIFIWRSGVRVSQLAGYPHGFLIGIERNTVQLGTKTCQCTSVPNPEWI